MSDLLRVMALPGYEPEIGRWMWAMEEVRRRTLKLVDSLDQRAIDWEGPDGRENAIGTLLYHIALVEMSWIFLDVQELPKLPPHVQADFPHEMATAGRLTPVLGVALDDHLEQLARSRVIFLDAFRSMALDDWRQLRSPGDVDYQVTPEWALFHLVEHEAGHAFQISSLRARAARRFGST